jgi:hypothetical protein
MSRIGAEIAARLLSRPGSVTAAATVTAVTEPPPLVKATPYVWKDSSTLPRREFLYGTHLIRRYVSVTVAPGGLGKSSLTMTEALAMATGRALLGTLPAADLRCWIFNLEDPRDELDRRLAASCKLHNVDAKSLNGRLFLDSGREQNLVVAFDDKRGVKIAVPTVEAVISEIKKNNIDVMIIDPFVSTHSVSENDNGAIDKVTKLWSQIADETNCAIEIVHHVRKVQDREVTVEDARGAVSLLAAARSARVLNRMTEEQAKAAGISDDERFSIFGVQAGKSNLAPLSSKSEWRKLESVPLGNGAGPQRPQDHAPVVVEWKWPEIEDAPAKEEEPGIQPLSFTDEELNLIKIRIKNTECKWDTRAGDWAGWKIAEVMGIEMDDQSKASIAMTIENLISGRILKKTEEKDSHGKVKKFVRVV